jgi:hypothetical protein
MGGNSSTGDGSGWAHASGRHGVKSHAWTWQGWAPLGKAWSALLEADDVGFAVGSHIDRAGARQGTPVQLGIKSPLTCRPGREGGDRPVAQSSVCGPHDSGWVGLVERVGGSDPLRRGIRIRNLIESFSITQKRI